MPTSVVTAVAFVIGAYLAPPVPAATPHHFDIPAGPASVALYELGHQAGMQINYDDYEAVKGIATTALKGDFTPQEALRRLLVGTGLVFKKMPGGALMVYHPQQGGRNPAESDAGPHVGPGRAEESTRPSTVVIYSAARGDIPGLVGVAALTIDSDELRHSGITATPDIINTLPQNFQGGPNENTVHGNSAETNSSFGSGVNLRGLSDDGTIVLLNSRRLAPSGTAGAFTDIANIPLSIIDHTEIIPEGSTARYGVDAIGGVVNFVTRQDDGAETRAQVGGLSEGAVFAERFSQFLGGSWDGGHITAAVEYDERDALPASRRLLATSDLTPFGGQNFDSPYGNPGTLETFSGNGYTTWAIPHSQNGTGLQSSPLKPNTQNLYDPLAGSTILPRQELTSGVLSGWQNVGESTTLFVDALLSRRLAQSVTEGEELPVTVTASNPYYFNPAGGTLPVTVFYDFGRDLGPTVTQVNLNSGQVTAGVEHQGGVFDHFEIYLGHAYERQHLVQTDQVNPSILQRYVNNDKDPLTAVNVFGDGSYTNPTTLAAIRGQASFALESRLETLDFNGYRTLFRIPGGDVLLTVDDEYRRQFLESLSDSPGTLAVTPTESSRTTLSTFVQAYFPVVGPGNRLPGIQSFNVSVAGRYEHYSDVGAVALPQLAMSYSPWQRILFRGTWAQLSHAPDLPDLSEASNVSTLYLLPTKTGYTTALIWTGNNSQLKSETATSWTLGTNVMPFEARNLSLGLTYFNTDFTNRIGDPTPLPLNVLEDPSQGWLLRAVTPAEQATVCARSHFLGIGADCLSTPVGAIVDLRRQNVASLRVQGMDMAVDYELDHGLNVWKLRLNSTYLFQYLEQQTPTAQPVEWVSTVHNPINFRMRTWLSWARRGLFVSGIVNFQNRYEDVASTPNRAIRSWTTVNTSLGYELPWGKHKTELSVSAQNVFNHMPPFVNNQYGIGYDQENASLLGRVVSFQIRQRW